MADPTVTTTSTRRWDGAGRPARWSAYLVATLCWLFTICWGGFGLLFVMWGGVFFLFGACLWLVPTVAFTWDRRRPWVGAALALVPAAVTMWAAITVWTDHIDAPSWEDPDFWIPVAVTHTAVASLAAAASLVVVGAALPRCHAGRAQGDR